MQPGLWSACQSSQQRIRQKETKAKFSSPSGVCWFRTSPGITLQAPDEIYDTF